MKKTILVIGLVLLSCTAFSQLSEWGISKCKAYARNKWGKDHTMVQCEFNLQVIAGEEFTETFDKMGCVNEKPTTLSDECLIFLQAYAEWSDEETGWVQWDKALLQAKKQVKEYKSKNPW